MKQSFVLDACAIIAFLAEEAGADIVEEYLIQAQSGKINLYMNSVNLLEVYYGIEKYEGQIKAKQILADMKKLPIRFIDRINENIFFSASYFKSNYKISLGDSFALATSKSLSAKLLTSDHHEFDIIDTKQDLEFVWIR